VVGIFGIVFGIFGLLGSGQSIAFPVIMKYQKQMMAQMEEQIQKETQKGGEVPTREMEMIKKMWDMPEWFMTWSVVAGLVGTLVSGFYIMASIFLLLLKRSGPKLFYIAAGICIALSAMKIGVALSASLLLGISFAILGAVFIICTGVLIAVTATSDKTAFRQTAGAAAPVTIN